MNLPAVRLAAYFGAIFSTMGILLPFWPVWLEAKGLGPDEIGRVMSLGVLANLVMPFLAHAVDRTGQRKLSLVLLAACAWLGFSLFALVDQLVAIAAVTVLFFPAWSSLVPLGDSLAILTSKQRNFDYGRVRLWGSIAFIVASIGGGAFLAGEPESMIYRLMLLCLGLVLAAALALPNTAVPPSARKRLPFLEIVADRRFRRFLLATFFIFPSHAAYYAFGTLHWQNAGYSKTVIGLFWAEGVVAEVVVFSLSGLLVRKLGPSRLLLVGALAGVLRWAGTGLSDDSSAIVLLQALHAFTFGASHVGAVHFIAERVNPAHSATAQSLYAATVGGLGMSLSMLLAGRLYDAHGGYAYLAMSALAAVGAVCVLMLRKSERDGMPASAPPARHG